MKGLKLCPVCLNKLEIKLTKYQYRAGQKEYTLFCSVCNKNKIRWC